MPNVGPNFPKIFSFDLNEFSLMNCLIFTNNCTIGLHTTKPPPCTPTQYQEHGGREHYGLGDINMKSKTSKLPSLIGRCAMCNLILPMSKAYWKAPYVFHIERLDMKVPFTL